LNLVIAPLSTGEGTSPAESWFSFPSNMSVNSSKASKRSFNYLSVVSPNKTGSVGSLSFSFNPNTILGVLTIK